MWEYKRISYFLMWVRFFYNKKRFLQCDLVKKFFWNSLFEMMIASGEKHSVASLRGFAVMENCSVGKLKLTWLLQLHVTAHLPTRLVQPAAAVSSAMARTRHPPTPHQKSQFYYYNSVTCFCNNRLFSSLAQTRARLCCDILVHPQAVV